jgi:E3 ubiquitin-protein ligase synoviolin
MEDFGDESKLSWLPCDRRHYFHNECIMFWLVKNDTCPLCKVEVDFEAAQRMKRANSVPD